MAGLNTKHISVQNLFCNSTGWLKEALRLMTHRADLSAVTKAIANNWADYSATALQLSHGERKKEQNPQLILIF